MKLLQHFFMMVAALLFANYSYAAEIPVYSDPNQPITVTATTPQFYIALPSNVTTGYNWIVDAMDNQVIKIDSVANQVASPQQLGSGGKTIWLLSVRPQAFGKMQSTQIALIYSRPWNRDDNPTRVVFNVNIK